MKTTEQQAIFAIAITVIASYLYSLILGRINLIKNVRSCLAHGMAEQNYGHPAGNHN
jgi:hypothetical protein